MIQTLSGNKPSSYSQQLIKDRNSTLLFNLVRKMAPISRADLARRSGLSPATVTILIDELIQRRWIREIADQKPENKPGRRPILLEVDGSCGYLATVELCNGAYECTLYDICLTHIASEIILCAGTTAEKISASLEAMLQAHEITEEKLLGIHVLYPGLIDSETQDLGISVLIKEANMPQRNLVSALQEKYGRTHVTVSNISSAMAYSVFLSEKYSSALPLLVFSVYEGISAGVVASGESCQQLEAGHIVIQPEGPMCKCGNRGCMEALCSNTSLIRQIAAKRRTTIPSEENYGSSQNRHQIDQIAADYYAGDPVVGEVLDDFAENLCHGLLSIINLLGIRSVYLGGILQQLGRPFVDKLQTILDDNSKIITTQGKIRLELFDDSFETRRKAAVMMSMEQLFQRY